MLAIITQLLRPVEQQDGRQHLGMSGQLFTDGPSNRFVEAASSILLGVTERALTGQHRGVQTTDPDARLKPVLSGATTGTF